MAQQRINVQVSVYPRLAFENTISKPKDFHVYDGGGGGPTVDSDTKNYVDAKTDAVKSQNDARFAEVLSRIDVLGATLGADVIALRQKVEAIPPPTPPLQMLAGLVSALAIAIGLVFAILAFSADRFDGGLAAGSVKDTILADQEARNDAQDEKLNRIIEILTTKPQQ